MIFGNTILPVRRHGVSRTPEIQGARLEIQVKLQEKQPMSGLS